MPPSLEERVAFLEGKVEEPSQGVGEVRELIVLLDGHVRGQDRRFTALDDKFTSLYQKLDDKVEGLRTELGSQIHAVDQKVDRFREELAARIDGMDGRLNSRIDTLDGKVSRQFLWLVGIQVAVLLSVVGALLRG